MKLIHKFKEHKLSKKKRKVILVKCWEVVFDTDGYAPEDGSVCFCATKTLAETIASILHKDQHGDAHYVIVYKSGDDAKEFIRDGFCAAKIESCFDVEGYNWACSYEIRTTEAEKEDIVTSLEELPKHPTICTGCCDEYFVGEFPPKSGVYEMKIEEDDDDD